MSAGHQTKEWSNLASSFAEQSAADDAPCHHCGGQIDYNAPPNHPKGFTADHLSPLGLGGAVVTDQLAPAHRGCNSRSGAVLGNKLRKFKDRPVDTIEVMVEPWGEDGGPLVGVDGEINPAFYVPWIQPLIDDMPDTATWPRIMSLPHPRAVDSLGWEVIERAEARRLTDPMIPRREKTLRWWQKLLIVRMYEIDADGVLCWPEVLLSTSRQVGKSVGLREIALDRITQADYFGEAQLVLHVAKDLTIADEIQRPARQWAGIMEDQGRDWHPVGNNGRWAVEYNGVMGRWLIRSQNSVYGFSASAALVDEAWAIDPGPISEGIEPTMAEREQPQLLIVSTAHAKATLLMPERRAEALRDLENPDEKLLIEWSAPREAELDKGNIAYHRMASPHWTAKRQKFIAAKINNEGFIEQWLNIWPDDGGAVERMVSPSVWSSIADPDLKVPDGPSSGHTVCIYPDITQGQWHIFRSGMDLKEHCYLESLGTHPSMKAALEVVVQLVRRHPAELIIPRHVRGRVPKLPGVRALINAGESDVAAASSAVKPMFKAGRLTHDGSEPLMTQMPRAVVDRYGDTIRISSKASETPVEAAKGAVLAVWWASRADRPRAVVI